MIYKFNIIEKILLNNDIIPHPFADIGSNVGLAKALGVAVKLRITDQLSSQPKNISAIAKGAGVSEKGVELILNCLNAMGYTEKVANDFRFTKRGIKCSIEIRQKTCCILLSSAIGYSIPSHHLQIQLKTANLHAYTLNIFLLTTNGRFSAVQ